MSCFTSDNRLSPDIRADAIVLLGGDEAVIAEGAGGGGGVGKVSCDAIKLVGITLIETHRWCRLVKKPAREIEQEHSIAAALVRGVHDCTEI